MDANVSDVDASRDHSVVLEGALLAPRQEVHQEAAAVLPRWRRHFETAFLLQLAEDEPLGQHIMHLAQYRCE